MNREIEFRGLKPNGEFVYGYYVEGMFDGTSSIVDFGIAKKGCYPEAVKPETVGQFTGLLDCNGVKIFEGDRVSFFDRDDNDFMMCGVVKFGVRGYPAFDIYDDKNATYSDEYNTLTNDDDFRFLVIGNIHQNSELLK